MRNVKCLFDFESIFNDIKWFGFCSENDLQTTNDNLNTHIDNKCEKSGAFKFMKIYKVQQKLEVIKTLLKHEVPVSWVFCIL